MRFLFRLVFGYGGFARYLRGKCQEGRRKYNPSFSDYVARQLLERRLYSLSIIRQILKEGATSSSLIFLDNPYVQVRAYASYEREITKSAFGFSKVLGVKKSKKGSDLRIAFVAFAHDLYISYLAR